jgi:beta-lactam-binding protein with PASTA domain/tRNA A-37 threonylcarbamoyl transferase component Bud32
VATTPTTDQVGRVLGGRYRLLAPLGSGASAQVFLADDVRLRRRVAVKVLHPALADDESFLRRFRAEAQSAASLSHPHILAVFDWSDDESAPFLVTEYLAGGTMRTLLDAGRRLSPAQALVVGLEAARGLDHAHKHGFVHRDIKPANLLFGADARLRIADFGLARAIAEAGWTEPTGAVLGTARYASPEQARGETLDGRSDVYSLALVLIEAVTGEVPFTADTTIGTLMARLGGSLEVPADLGPLRPAIDAAGQVEHGDRPDAAAFGRALVQAAPELTRPAPLPLVRPAPDVAGAAARRDATLLGPGATAPGNGAGPGGNGNGAGGNGVAAGVVAAGVVAGGADDTTAVTVRDEGPTGGRSNVGADARSSDDTTRQTSVRPPVREPSGGVPPHQAAPPPWRVDDGSGRDLSSNDRSARRLMIGAAVVVVAVVVGLVGGWFYTQAQIPSYAVPERLIGMQRDALPTAIEDFHWEIQDEMTRRDGTEPGQILETRPGPGEDLREGATLHVVVSEGPTLVDVPAGLTDMTGDDAAAALEAAELRAELVDTRSAEVAEGDVIGFADGAPGAQLPKGSIVRLEVSVGNRFELPSVRGEPYSEAVAELEAMGLVVDVASGIDGEVEPGDVIGTEPGATTEVGPGDAITVVVAVDEVKVPKVRGRSLEEATRRIEERGLTVGDVVGSDSGRVVGTWPIEGSEVSSGTSVTLVMRRR